jgi:Flp pilus assembly protein TadG
MRRSWPRHLLRRVARATDGAVAPTIAISLFALVAMGGVAWDYARLASMDSELQNAADQAALAAASQLDGQTGAVDRATAAAQGLIANQTLMANDSHADGLSVTIPTVVFYTTKADAEADTNGFTDTARFAEAKFVRVAVEPREAFYALTPIVNAFSSGDIGAEAVAGLGSAICKTPPVMICNPAEPLSNTDTELDFDANGLKGVGLKLITGDADAPGNFGFLETGFGSGAADLARALGYNAPPGDCAPTNGVETKPGMNAVVMNAINTRFDVYENGANTCPAGGTCSPSRNTRKDLVKTGAPSGNCGGWQEADNSYRPATTTPLTSGYPDIMGHPRDLCHAVSDDGTCTYAGLTPSKVGNGVWDRDAYFKVNYGWADQATWTAQTGLSSSATRYEVYTWELAHTSTADKLQGPFSSKTGYSYPVCTIPGITPNATTVDRRRISAAVLNCKALGLTGHESGQPVLKWIDMFLVEPSFDRGSGPSKRTDKKDVYVEVIGETNTGAAGQTAGQVVKRDVPYLIK